MTQEVDIKNIIVCLHEFLQQQPTSVGEHLLIQHLTKAELFAPFADGSPSFVLFKKHFLTMHGLYSLQQMLEGSGQLLRVSPLNVQLLSSKKPSKKSSQGNDVCGKNVDQSDVKLSQYYLDLDNFFQATEDSVDDLLSSFWKRFAQWQVGSDAFSVLGLSTNATWEQVQKAYRKKAQLEHPDKGGDSKRFAEYTEAYQSLKAKFLS